MSEKNHSPHAVVVRNAIRYARDVEEVTGCRPLVQLAVSPELFRAVTSEMRTTPESEEMRIAGGLKLATFGAVALREGWSDMLAGTSTLANTLASRRLPAPTTQDDLRAALAEALDGWERHSAGAAKRRIGGPDSGDRMQLARIAELRAKFLGSGNR